jgi:lipoprotein-anchoring transpeptidase ErfK/SrfK
VKIDNGRTVPPAAMKMRNRPAVSTTHLCLLLIALFLAGCAVRDTEHHIVISTREQKLALLEHGNVAAIYPISTSKFGLGDWRGSYRTPLGEMEIAQKIGEGAETGTVFKDMRRTGEIIAVDAPGRDPIVTRILWLRGREAQNANSFGRHIYIHGTPEERRIGLPVSYGCVRMRSSDVINLYNMVGLGARVTIVDAPLASVVPAMSSASSMDPRRNPATLVIR